MAWAPPGARGRFDDIHSVQQGGLIDEDQVERRKIIKREEVRKRIAEEMMSQGTARALFDNMDTDNSGDVDIGELKAKLTAMGLSVMHQDADDLLAEMDTDGNGKITFDEFEMFMKSDQRQSKVKSFDDRIQQRRRNQQTSLGTNDCASSAISFGKNTDQSMQSDFGNMTNGKPMPAARRTSYALGHDIKRESFYAEREFRRAEKREKVRKTLSSRLREGGGVDKLFTDLDKDGSGDISVKEMRRGLDKMGLSIMHQDSESLMASMDTDKNGRVVKTEFEAFLNSSHKEAMEQAEAKAIEDLKFQQGADPIQPTVERPFMKPTILSTQKLVKQVFRRQSITDDGGSGNKLEIGKNAHWLPVGAANVNPSVPSPNLGEGFDGKIYDGLSVGPSSFHSRRSSREFGRMLLPSLTAPLDQGIAEFNSNAAPRSPPVTTKAQTFPLSKGSSKTQGFKHKAAARGPFSASWPVKRNVVHNFSSPSRGASSSGKKLYRSVASRPKSQKLQRRIFPASKWLRGRKVLANKVAAQDHQGADLSVLERFASVAISSDLAGGQHIPTRSFGKERRQQQR